MVFIGQRKVLGRKVTKYIAILTLRISKFLMRAIERVHIHLGHPHFGGQQLYLSNIKKQNFCSDLENGSHILSFYSIHIYDKIFTKLLFHINRTFFIH